MRLRPRLFVSDRTAAAPLPRGHSRCRGRGGQNAQKGRREASLYCSSTWKTDSSGKLAFQSPWIGGAQRNCSVRDEHQNRIQAECSVPMSSLSFSFCVRTALERANTGRGRQKGRTTGRPFPHAERPSFRRDPSRLAKLAVTLAVTELARGSTDDLSYSFF
jgi:hypothetical protein